MIQPGMTKRKRSEHYVNNKEFLAALIAYREEREVAEAKGLPRPVIPRYIGECFLKIATHLSFKPNFVNYMFKDDMVSDGIENCVQYIHNFNPEVSKSFCIFHTNYHYAFLRRIQREKRQLENQEQDFGEVWIQFLMITTPLTDRTTVTIIPSRMQSIQNFVILNFCESYSRT